jgi:DNA-binding transcriptional MerR regulator
MIMASLVQPLGETPAVDPPAETPRPHKSSAAFRTISEVADELDVAQHVLRFWESKFTQVRPLKRGGGRRYYRPEDVDLLRQIRSLLYEEGYTIKGAQKLLRARRGRTVVAGAEAQPGAAPVPSPAEPPAAATALAPRRAAAGAAAATAAATRGLPADAKRRIKALRHELSELKDVLGRARREIS